jgi:hypothetical protein
MHFAITTLPLHHVTPWSTVFLQKVIAAPIVKKLSMFYVNLTFHYHGHKNPPLVPILCQPTSSHPIYVNHFNIILLSRLRSFK